VSIRLRQRRSGWSKGGGAPAGQAVQLAAWVAATVPAAQLLQTAAPAKANFPVPQPPQAEARARAEPVVARK
jgi:hypothetical protein